MVCKGGYGTSIFETGVKLVNIYITVTGYCVDKMKPFIPCVYRVHIKRAPIVLLLPSSMFFVNLFVRF